MLASVEVHLFGLFSCLWSLINISGQIIATDSKGEITHLKCLGDFFLLAKDFQLLSTELH